MAELAIRMDQDNQAEDSMKIEVIYFDRMHKRVKQWKTLTAWAYHPPTRRLLRFAIMEYKGETTESENYLIVEFIQHDSTRSQE